MWRRYLKLFLLAVGLLTPCFLIFNLFNLHPLSADEQDILSTLHHKREFKYNTLTKCLAKSTIAHNSSILLHRMYPSDTKLALLDSSKGSWRSSCRTGYVPTSDGRCSICPEGTFSLPQWMFCQPRLTCDQISHNVQVSKLLYTIGNWKLYSAEWDGYDVMYAVSTDSSDSLDESQSSLLFPHENILYSIGFCDNEQNNINIYVTDSFTETFLGSALELNSILSRQTGCDNWIVRFHLAIDYIRILTHLHDSHGNNKNMGPRVLCNSHTLQILLSQFLITDKLELVFVPTDNLPQVSQNDGLIKCSKRALRNDFVAPEQQWPYHDLKVFNYHQQPGYNEKTDVWKIPDVVKVFLGAGNDDDSDNGRFVLDHLFVIHQHCKDFDPASRPTASQVLEEYMSVWKLMV